MIFLAGLFWLHPFSMEGQTAPSRQASIDEFTKGNYDEAYKDFRLLLQKYPKDPLYKYYSGVCLVMMKKDPAEALTLLQQSVSGASVVRSLPPDALFYLGRAQQMSGKFTEAIASFSQYADQVGKKAARENGVQGYIQDCENRKGIVEASEVASAKPVIEEKAGSGLKDETADSRKTLTDTGTAEKTGRKPLPQDYENILDEALRLQYKSDSLNMLAGEQKKQLDNLSEAEKASLKMKISQNEILAANYQKSADQKYNEAQTRMNPGLEIAPSRAEALPDSDFNRPVVQKSAAVVPESPARSDTAGRQATAAARSKGPTSLFEVLPKDAAYPDEKIKIDPEMPSGLLYRIQLAVFRNPVAPSFFKGITPVYGIRMAGTDKTNYYAGMFRRSADAKKALMEVKTTGFRDAFIVSLADNKPISSDRAAVLENEWGSKPLFAQSGSVVPSDTLPPTLSFRVEVARSAKPLKPDAVEALRSLSGSRGLDIIHLADGNIVYLIGKFITFESAAEYADLLVRNNYREAKVVAWLGDREVPVDTARKLFNKL